MGVAEGYETLLPFVPQDQSHTAETLQQGQPPDALEARVVTQYERQPVTGNSTAKMVDVVNADVGGKPAQDAGEGVVRAAVKRDLLHIPGVVVGPDGVLELMLDIEQPDADLGCQQHDR